MATVQLSNHSLTRFRHLGEAGQAPNAPPTSPSFARLLGRLGQLMLGVIMLLLGGAMVLTLWLLPFGLPLALLGMALLTAPSDF